MCIIRVGQITQLLSKRLVSMDKFDEEHESVNYFLHMMTFDTTKSSKFKMAAKMSNLKENGKFQYITGL